MAKTKEKQKSNLAENIVAGRKKYGWTGPQLAEKAGVPYPTLRDIEANLSSGSPATIEKIAQALNIESWQLQVPEYWLQAINQSKEQILGSLFLELSSLDESQLRSAANGIRNAILAAKTPSTSSRSKTTTG